jgi:hypothetical protein
MTDHMTPAQAWERFVGNQSPAEFMEISRANGYATAAEAVTAYVVELPRMFPDDGITLEDAVTAAPLLLQYLIDAGE